MNAMTVEHSNGISRLRTDPTRVADSRDAAYTASHCLEARSTARGPKPLQVGLVVCLAFLATGVAAAQTQPAAEGTSRSADATEASKENANTDDASHEHRPANSGGASSGEDVSVQVQAVIAPSIPTETIPPGQRVDVILIPGGVGGLIGEPIRLARNVRLIRVASLAEEMIGSAQPGPFPRHIIVRVPKDQAALLTDAQKRGTLHVVPVGDQEKSRRVLPPLTDMLTTALKKNPDLRVAEAKLQEAEAELNRTRLEVVQKVMTLQNAWQVQERLIDQATDEVTRLQDEVKRAESRFLQGTEQTGALAMAKSRLKKAETELLQAEAELAQLEASIPYILGEQAAVAVIDHRNRAGMGRQATGGGMMPGMMLGGEYGGEAEMMGGGAGGMGMPGGEESMKSRGTTRPRSPGKEPSKQAGKRGSAAIGMESEMGMGGGSIGMESGMGAARAKVREMLSDGTSSDAKAIAERIRAALGSPTELEFDKIPLPEAVEFLSDLHGINFFIDAAAFQAESPYGAGPVKPEEMELTIALRDVPLGAALQAIEDTQGSVRFVVRDYGILVTRKGFEPPGSVSARDFWKGKTAGYDIGTEYKMRMMEDAMKMYSGGSGFGGFPGSGGTATPGTAKQKAAAGGAKRQAPSAAPKQH